MSHDVVSLTGLILSCLSLGISFLHALLALAKHLSTHKIEYVTKESQAALRQSLGVPPEEFLADEQEMQKLSRQFDGLYQKAGLGDASWGYPDKKDLDG